MAVKIEQKYKQGQKQFLSRLCGGEVGHIIATEVTYFLSRLCGGEDKLPHCSSTAIFLSRLCGGEGH